MARAARVVSESGFYHIIVKSGHDIFEESEDFDEFIKILQNALAASDSEFIACSAGGDHAHIALKNTSATVGKTLKPAFTSFARYYNRMHGIEGKLFADRFSSEAIDENALIPLLDFFARYHDLNVYTGNYGEIPAIERGEVTLFADLYRAMTSSEIIARLADFTGADEEEFVRDAKTLLERKGGKCAVPTAVINIALGAKITLINKAGTQKTVTQKSKPVHKPAPPKADEPKNDAPENTENKSVGAEEQPVENMPVKKKKKQMSVWLL